MALKKANSTSFKKGDNRKRKQKGDISEKVKFWNELKDFMTNEGAERYKEELMTLEGKEFIVCYTALLEYFQPKLIRTEIKAEVHNKTTVDIPDQE